MAFNPFKTPVASEPEPIEALTVELPSSLRLRNPKRAKYWKLSLKMRTRAKREAKRFWRKRALIELRERIARHKPGQPLYDTPSPSILRAKAKREAQRAKSEQTQ